MQFIWRLRALPMKLPRARLPQARLNPGLGRGIMGIPAGGVEERGTQTVHAMDLALNSIECNSISFFSRSVFFVFFNNANRVFAIPRTLLHVPLHTAH